MDSLRSLQEMQNCILQKMQCINNLNIKFKEKQQNEFLKTYMQIMDKMSNDLLEAEEQYRNIDQEIQKDERCVQLATQLNFFRGQCFELRAELDQIEIRIQEQKMKNEELLKEKIEMKGSLVKKSKQANKYRTKAISLNKTIFDSSAMKTIKPHQHHNETTITPEKKSKYNTIFYQSLQEKDGRKMLNFSTELGKEKNRTKSMLKKVSEYHRATSTSYAFTRKNVRNAINL